MTNCLELPPELTTGILGVSDSESACNRLHEILTECMKDINKRLEKQDPSRKRFARESSGIIGKICVQIRNSLIENGYAKRRHDGLATRDMSFVEILENLGTPESKKAAAIMKSQAPVIDKQLGKRINTTSIHRNVRHKTENALGERKRSEKTGELDNDPLEDAIGQLLLAERNNPFSPEQKKALLEMHTYAVKLTKNLQSTSAHQIELDEYCPKLNEIYGSVEKALVHFRRISAARKYIQIATDKLHESQANPITDIDEEPSGQTSTEEHMKRLMAEHESINAITQIADLCIKEHFAKNPECITEVTTILKEIKVLCGKLVKFDIDEITGWEIGIAARQWPLLGERIPAGSLLSKTNPSMMDMAFVFLAEHEDFLTAYNQAKQGRQRLNSLNEEIQMLQEQMAETGNKSPRLSPSIIKHHRLEKVILEAQKEIQIATEDLNSIMRDLAVKHELDWYGFSESTGKLCNAIWINVNDEIIKPMTENLDWIDSKIIEIEGIIESHR